MYTENAKLSKYDSIQELKTSSMLLAPTLEEHYIEIKKLFGKEDVILDVGCGNRDFEKYVPNATGIDETTDILQFDLSKYNTLYFGESIGYLSFGVIKYLLNNNFINKVVIKDFIDDRTHTEYFNFRVNTLSLMVLPMLRKYGYNVIVKSFTPNTTRWKSLLEKYSLKYDAYPGTVNVIVTATK